jgi:Arc/MetJ family transcription regulator
MAPSPKRRSERKRTTLVLPVELLQDAERLLGTPSHTEAVIVALEELVARRHREELLRMDWSDLTPEAVDEMRRQREFTKPPDA